MLRLKNIRKDENRIFADYYPEDSKVLFGTVSVSLTDPKDYDYVESGYERDYNSHKAHAISYLRRVLRGQEVIKEEVQLMWC